MRLGFEIQLTLPLAWAPQKILTSTSSQSLPADEEAQYLSRRDNPAARISSAWCGRGGSLRRKPSDMRPAAEVGRWGSGKTSHNHTPNGSGTRHAEWFRPGPGRCRLRLEPHQNDVGAGVRWRQPPARPE